MATETLHKFGEFPSEVSLKVWQHFLEDEAGSRRVVVWDGRVMPFANLVSPLLSVNRESRGKALEFYPVSVNMYCLPETGQSSRPASGDDGEDETNAPVNSTEVETAGALAERARRLLASAQPTAPTMGVIHLNLARDTILHGYNGGVHFFVRKTSDIGQGLENSAPLWHTFSARLPTPTLQTAKHVLRVLTSHSDESSLETSLFKRVPWARDPAKIIFESITLDMDLLHPVLSLDKKESDDLMSHISDLSKPLPGILDAWLGWKEPTAGGNHQLVFVNVDHEIERWEAQSLADIKRTKEALDKVVEEGLTLASSEDYQEMNKIISNFEESVVMCIGSIKNCNTTLCACWRKRWA